MTLLLQYCRERIPARLFVPVIVGITGAGLWAADTWALSALARAGAVALLLVTQFRLWDDIADADADRAAHPDLPPPVPAIAFNLASAGIVERHRPDQGPQMLVRGELATGRVRL